MKREKRTLKRLLLINLLLIIILIIMFFYKKGDNKDEHVGKTIFIDNTKFKILKFTDNNCYKLSGDIYVHKSVVLRNLNKEF